MKRNPVYSKKIFIIVTSFFFCSAFLLGRYTSLPWADEIKDDLSKKSAPRFTGKSKGENNTDLQNKNTAKNFQERLQGNLTIEDLNALFNEAFDPNEYEEYSSEKKCSQVIQKWGQIIPLQSLKKLEETPGGTDYLFPLFSGWASKNPDAALAYYEEHYKEDSKHSAIILNAIIGEYASQSPEKAWSYLFSQESDFLPDHFHKIKQTYLKAVALNHPEQIPELIEKTELFSEQATYQNETYLAYETGLCWGEHDTESREWLKKLPYEERIQAEAGRIMGITKGDTKKIEALLSTLPLEDQVNITRELAPKIISNGLDTKERLDWLVNSSLEAKDLERLSSQVKRYFFWDESSKNWVDSLPPGEKKMLFQKWQENVAKNIEILSR